MSEQQSQKHGVRSEGQKMARAREGYDPIPPSNPVAGAFGGNRSETPTDQDTALGINESRKQEAEEDKK